MCPRSSRSARKSPLPRRPWLEVLEDRTLLSSSAISFNSVAGSLFLSTGAAGAAARVAGTGDGGIAVTIGGRLYSSDAGASFTPALAGASAAALRNVGLTGGGAADTLTLDHLAAAGGLTVSSDGGLTVAGDVSAAGRLAVTCAGLLNVQSGGSLTARGGSVTATADAFVNVGSVRADGGPIDITSRDYLNAGTVRAAGAGGAVQVDFTRSYVDTAAARTTASGAGGAGGEVRIDGGSGGRLFSSGRFTATGTAGGDIDLFGGNIFLIGATVDASGTAAGGRVRVGGDYQGDNTAVSDAQTVNVSGTTVLRADGGSAGGRVIVWSQANTDFSGSVSARAGGFIEVSSHGQLTYGGTADAGRRGKLLLDPKNLIVSADSASFPQFDLIAPDASADFGAQVVSLPDGNVVETDPLVGSVYLFNGQTGALLSELTGTGDGPEVTALANGNFVVASAWDDTVDGAVTWGSGTTGVSGVVSATNSLIGLGTGNLIPVTPLTNGNYVVTSVTWHNRSGAVTWASGTGPTTGVVSAANSLVGNPGDMVGGSGVTALADGNYVVDSPDWDGGRGAVTWGNGATGIAGPVSAANSLVGSNSTGAPIAPDGDTVGDFGVTALSNGNYVVLSYEWNDQGAATWGNGATGITGPVSAANSLVGSATGYGGPSAVTALTNGNYVVASPGWGSSDLWGRVGAVTWGNGMTGITGTISTADSLIGSEDGDGVGGGWGNGDASGVIALANGNYVVDSYDWHGDEGAVTWGNGTTGTAGVVSAANSLVGNTGATATDSGDQVGGGPEGVGGVTALANGNYVVDSPYWGGTLGAVTWGNGVTGVTGPVSAANSLIGSEADDEVGMPGSTPGAVGVTALANGNYVVVSPYWYFDEGAVTWGNGTTGTTGTISTANSLVGTDPSTDRLGYGGVTALTNGNYVVFSQFWQGEGAVTWGNGATGTAGTVSPANSFIGGALINYDLVAIRNLPNGDYLIGIAGFGSFSVTWVDGTTGTALDGQTTFDAQNTLTSAGAFAPIGSGNEFVVGRTVAFTDPNLLTFALAQDQTITVTPDFITRTLDAGTDVTLQASTDITVDSPIVEDPTGNPGSLTLQAGRSILVNADIDTAGGNLTLIANDTPADGVVAGERDPGGAAITVAPGVTLDTGSGTLTTDLMGGQAPAVTTHPASQEVIAGSPVTFTASASGTPAPAVQWQVSTDGGQTFSDVAGATSTTFTFTVTAGQNGDEYQAIFVNSAGTATSNAATLTVDFAPVVTTPPVNQTALAGGAVTFTAAASANPTPGVQWQVSTDGGKTFSNVAGETFATLSFTAAAAQNGDEYRAVFSNSAGTATSMAATLTVVVPPAVTTNPTARAVSAGQKATFTASASGTPAPTVQWQVSTDGGKTFSSVAGATSATLTVTATPEQNGSEYRAVFTNSAGRATTRAAALTVYFAPVIARQPSGESAAPGGPVTFTAAASGSPAPAVQWQVSTNGGKTFSNVAGATSATLTFTAPRSYNGRQYRAVFSNAYGKAVSAAAALAVGAPPVVLTNPVSQSVVAGRKVTFTAAAGGSPAPSVQWQVSTDGGKTYISIKGATAPALSFTVFATENGDLIRAVFTNALGQAVTKAARLATV